jgi:hypothetical protein
MADLPVPQGRPAAWGLPEVVDYVLERGYKRVTLQFPDDMLEEAPVVASALQEELSGLTDAKVGRSSIARGRGGRSCGRSARRAVLRRRTSRPAAPASRRGVARPWNALLARLAGARRPNLCAPLRFTCWLTPPTTR